MGRISGDGGVANSRDSFRTRRPIDVDGQSAHFFSLSALEGTSAVSLAPLPYSLRVLLENLLRHEDGDTVDRDAILGLAAWRPGVPPVEVAFRPARVLMPDSSGGPLLVDLAGMRDELAIAGGDPGRIRPAIPLDLVVDHSGTVAYSGTPDALRRNQRAEFAMNRERYSLIRWAQQALRGMRVVPPGNGILHQINLEYLAQVVRLEGEGEQRVVLPDSLVGMDSHTPMVNALGVFGWGVGGIEAASALLGEPISMLVPEVVACRFIGRLRPGATATDLVLTLTALLRAHNVVGKFVEFCGPGLDALPLPDRATVANMAPEYGATMGFFPVDAETLHYLRQTGRPEARVRLVERYAREQRLWRAEEPAYASIVELDLGTIEPTLAGPRRPQDRVGLAEVGRSFHAAFSSQVGAATGTRSQSRPLRHGDVVIAAITSCTNTSNPKVMIGAGLLARNAAARGLRPRPWVKTSLSPGSRRVSEYLAHAGLGAPLEALGFHAVGFGCMTCMGNSGDLAPELETAIRRDKLAVAAVLSGNRNFEARVHPLARAAYLASPPLVIAYALAGTMLCDLESEPLGTDAYGAPVFLRDLWPADEEIDRIAEAVVSPELFRAGYARVEEGGAQWEAVSFGAGPTFGWDPRSTYIGRPPYVRGGAPLADIEGARALVMLGDDVTTDHIAPVGSTSPESQVGRYLVAHGVAPADFNSLSSRRAHPEVVARTAYANVRLRNEIVPGAEGDVTRHFPGGEVMSIFEAAERYRADGVVPVAIAGRNYGVGSSRDTAAKSVRLLGVRAVLAESFERIHRSNLVGIGVLPLQFADGVTRRTLGLSGGERFDITGLSGGIRARSTVMMRTHHSDGRCSETVLHVRVDTAREADWCAGGGILPYVLARVKGA